MNKDVATTDNTGCVLVNTKQETVVLPDRFPGGYYRTVILDFGEAVDIRELAKHLALARWYPDKGMEFFKNINGRRLKRDYLRARKNRGKG